MSGGTGDGRRRITCLVPNVGGSSLGFATAYARALAEEFSVQVVGPDFWGSGVIELYRGAFDYTVVETPKLYRFPEFFAESRRLRAAITGDVLLAFKAMPQTVWVALREKKRRGCPVVVCLDEWDGALMARRSARERRAFWWRHWMHPLEDNYYPWVERQFGRVDRVVSTSTFLQRKFGGEVIRMGADTERFRPLDAGEKQAVRSELGLLPEHRVIVFGGVVRPHKGVEMLLDAMARAGDPMLRLLVVGPVTDALSELMAGEMGGMIVAAGAKPSADMPRWLGAGDMTILPMTDDLLSQSQVPCKVYEAMAMGLPVVAGAVSDLPDIVEGAGRVFAPDDTEALAGILREWRERPEVFARLGRHAREKCVERYSAKVMQKKLLKVINSLV